jgi:zinc/manganese transport system substrate-binding protein
MKKKALLVLGLASVLALAGCASGGAGQDDGRISVVASTNVYGQIAEAIGGDDVDVASLISQASQDPHSFEPSARDQLSVSRADLVIENGGGYDPFMDQLIEASGTNAPVITAAELSPEWPEHDDHATEGDGDDHDHVEGFNEHVWYDPATMGKVAAAIADELSKLDSSHAATFEANVAAFEKGIDTLSASLAALGSAHDGATVFVTEPVPLYLTAAAGLENTTPPAFSEAVEEGQDVPPATLLEALDLIRSGSVDVLIVNAQTGGAETDQVVAAAKEKGVPVLSFTETLPQGKTYLEWMTMNVEDLQSALA